MTNNTPLPQYPYGTAPDHLRTKTQLDQTRLTPGQQVATLTWGKGSRARSVALYDIAEATPKPPLSDKQISALATARAARRTCKRCGQDPGFILEDNRLCPNCQEQERLAHITNWTKDMLNQKPLILDTETTGLLGYMCDIAIIDTTGEVLFNTLVNPPCPIPPKAQEIHGISNEMVAGAPTFASIETQLQQILTGRPIITYNAAFDLEVLHRDICHAHGRTAYTPSWARSMDWFCLMLLYAEWVGDWLEESGSYRWHRLPNARHRALGDSQAALTLLKQLAEEVP